MKIMIVDDSKAMRMIVKRTLRQAGISGHDLIEAADGLEALEAIRQAPPDLVLCDWNMPNMNGIDLLKALKSEGCCPKFGFVTSEGTAEMRAEAAEAGAIFLIAKPFTPETFAGILGPIVL